MSGIVNPKDLTKHLIEHEILGIGNQVSGGSLSIIAGYPVYVDPTRSNKILTISRNTFTAGKSGKAKNVYISSEDVNTQKTGIRMARKGTIIAAAVQNSKTNTYVLRMRRNNSLTNLVSLSVSGGLGTQDTGVNADFDAGDIIQFFIEGIANDPHAWVEVAWRVT